MTTIKELKKQLERERKKAKIQRKVIKVAEERARIKKELFILKHGRKIRVAKSVGRGFKRAGSNLGTSFKELSGGFQQQRKKGTGVGGFLQRIADNQ